MDYYYSMDSVPEIYKNSIKHKVEACTSISNMLIDMILSSKRV